MKYHIQTIRVSLLIIWMLSLYPSPNNYTETQKINPREEQYSLINHLWVDGLNGNDENNGLTRETAFRTIQRAADIAGPGTTLHILPGIYRETVQPKRSGIVSAPIIFRAENGPVPEVTRCSGSFRERVQWPF